MPGSSGPCVHHSVATLIISGRKEDSSIQNGRACPNVHGVIAGPLRNLASSHLRGQLNILHRWKLLTQFIDDDETVVSLREPMCPPVHGFPAHELHKCLVRWRFVALTLINDPSICIDIPLRDLGGSLSQDNAGICCQDTGLDERGDRRRAPGGEAGRSLPALSRRRRSPGLSSCSAPHPFNPFFNGLDRL